MRAYPETPDSIARAKAYQQQERDRVARLSGVRMTEAGPVYVDRCGRCGHVVTAQTHRELERALSTHFIYEAATRPA